MTSSNSNGNHISDTNEINKETGNGKRIAPYIVTFFVMYAIWIVFSGKFDLFHLSLGVISSLIVSILSADLIFSSHRFNRMPSIYIGFIKYIPWLIYQIILANFHVMKIVLHPKMMDLIDPKIINFKSSLEDEVALVTFANSITLTPGTITVSVSSFRNFSVHALDGHSGDPLPGEMQERVENIFSEK